MTRRVSIKDIATQVGVSTALVSYVLNGLEKEKRVSKEVVRKIRQAASDLNYKPNQIARSLRKGTTNTLGLIITDIANPFFGQMARVIEDSASKSKYIVLIGSSDEDSRKSESLVETFLNRQVDGFILVPSEGDDSLVQALIQKEIPFVLLDRHFPEISCNYVVLDNYKATFETTLHLVSKGYKKITMVAYQSALNNMQERVRGYREAMETSNLKEFIRTKTVGFNSPDLHERMNEIVCSEETEALLFATNMLTIAGLYAIQQNHLAVPEKLAVVGFDGSEVFDFFNPPLSYIQQPFEKMGQEAVRILLNQINGDTESSQIQLAHKLFIRASGG